MIARLRCWAFGHPWHYAIWTSGQGSRLCVRCGLTEWIR